MKQLKLLLLTVCILILISCSQNATEPVDETSESPDIMDEENNEASSEDDSKNEPADISDVDNDSGETNEQSNEQNETDEEALDTSDEASEVAPDKNSGGDAERILRNSFEAMSELTSVHMQAQIDMHERMNGDEVIEDKSIDMTMLLEEPYTRHFALEINSNMAEPIISEVYELEDAHYIHSSVHDVNWSVGPNPMGLQQLSPLIANEQIEAYLSTSELFEVSEGDTEYILTFGGPYDQVLSSVYGGVKAMLQQIGKEMPRNLEEMSSSYVITVDKDTHYIKGYQMNYEGKVPEDQGEYVIEIDQTITVDEYNEHDEIIVPQEIIDEAVTMMDNAGNATLVEGE